MADVLQHIRHFIVPYDVTATQAEALNYYGIPSERLVRIGASEKIFCRQLFASSIPANEGGVSEWALDFLRSNQRVADRLGSRKLYLARGSTRKRPIENEDEVAALLSSRGYEIVEGHKMTFPEQIQAMETAEIIVALGGDGFMLQTLHTFTGKGKPIYGMNKGTVGFLMNEYHDGDLMERLAAAEKAS